ncbi:MULTISPECIES: thiol reductant ABC exporter subunit CydC [unclassified Niallia]|uniref:thiol reductant ABC exporter subunit CydC n=1 Tax=unclassified Niallia TaxID=2837522 RepID=UPI001EDAF89F|nr:MULTISPECIES: thiol reductant ABC exporter subunit CydC [unclassified Niallia]MDL0435330.1 thiol reductant ABC exporter subunit CydC [Niallia sp. SS-2023]UPO87525.1 thiol reductant ABC exporter subunit CydC [Niallia sp. Man26]
MKEDKWIFPFMRENAGRILIILLLAIMALGTGAMLTFTSGFLISRSAMPIENILMVYIPIVGVRAFGISRAVFSYLERLAGHDAVLRILSKMRIKLYRILEPQALFIKSRFKMGDMLGVLAEDIEQLQYIYLRTIFPTIAAFVLYIIVICSIGILDIPFAILMAIYLALLLIVFPICSLFLMRKKQTDYKQRRNGLYQRLTDSVLGITDWVISGRSGSFISSYEEDEVSAAQVNSRLTSFSRWRNFAQQAVSALVITSLLVWAAEQYAQGHIPATLIAAIVLVALPILDALLVVSEAFERIPGYQDSLNRLKKIENGAEQKISAQETAAKEDSVHIKLEQVSYSYTKADIPSVQNVSVDIPQGKRIAVIGRSGAGKSTLLKLIQGAIPAQVGRVSYNGKTACVQMDSSAIISVLNQNPHLFDTTLRNNVLLGSENAGDKELNEAINLAQLSDLVQKLPEGLDTFMQETGQRFSGGERQRVALARILLKDTPVVILDEPNASLDPRTEKELLQTIFTALEGKSVIWITHHLVGVEHMDEILFMEAGQIVMRGTHTELLKEKRYRQLYELDHPDFLLKKDEA